MGHIFISYNQQDHPYARRLADSLLQQGFDVWIDDRIDYGEDWWRTIVKAIRNCSAFVVIMTPDSDQSRWVQREVTIADELHKPIFPLLLAGEIVNSENWMIFVRTQYIDVRDNNMPDHTFFTGLARCTPKRDSAGVEVTPKKIATIATDEVKPVKAKNNNSDSLIDIKSVLPAPFEWCKVKSGSVLIEDATIDGGSHGGQYDVSRFYIAKYPITNAQYQAFIDAEESGFFNPLWWDYSSTAQDWHRYRYRPKAVEHDHPQMPRTNVSWYDAMAFCAWLTHELFGAQEALPLKIALPTEAQWQFAAQGDDERQYPWGDKFDTTLCNTPPSRQRKPTVVTRYTRGASPFGVFDMIGNVWEWCLNEWETDGIDLNGNNGRIIRGGSWDYSHHFANTTKRNWHHPYEENNSQGFRVIMVAK